LELDWADMLHHAATMATVDVRKAEAIDRWLSRAQPRFAQDLIAQVKVHRLRLPTIVNQVNRGAQVIAAVLPGS
jgi:hypothetical protein